MSSEEGGNEPSAPNNAFKCIPPPTRPTATRKGRSGRER